MQRILHASDTPHAIALGVSIGVFAAFLPIVGIQMLVGVAIAALLRANKAVTIPVVWITNPLTIVPIYYGCYRVGKLFTPPVRRESDRGLQRVFELASSAQLFDPAFWKSFVLAMTEAGAELWIGCVVVASLSSIAAYFPARWLVTVHRRRRDERRSRRMYLRQQRAA